MTTLPTHLRELVKSLRQSTAVLEDISKEMGHPKKRPVYRPYPKQIEFHEAGLAHRERLFLAGNQLGKTMAGAFEEAAHATGKYPIWWAGRRFDRPTHSWVAGVTGESTRDTVQRALIGEHGRGGGALRLRQIETKVAARGGVAGL